MLRVSILPILLIFLMVVGNVSKVRYILFSFHLQQKHNKIKSHVMLKIEMSLCLRKISKIGKIDTLSIQIRDCSLSYLNVSTSIKRGGVKHRFNLWAQT
jgi:hypothetical protein